MKSKARLSWVSTTRHTAWTSPLRRLVRSASLPSAAAATTAEATIADATAAAGASIPIDWPKFVGLDTPQERLALLLRTAAQVEHALLVQYLYAGYSLPSVNADRRPLLGIAIEEMSHLMTVQNLLFSIGEPPHLARQDFGTPADDADRLFPFDLILEPLSKHSLAKYIVAESPDEPWPDVDPGLAAVIADEALGQSGETVNRVGLLYGLLGVFVGNEALLDEKAQTGDPWYVLVKSLAEQAAEHYGGRDQVHLPDTFVFVDDPRQGTKDMWDRSQTGQPDEFRIHRIDSRVHALEALRDIGIQGEGPSTQEDSHFKRFVHFFRRAFGDTGTGPGPIVTHAVPAAARIQVLEGSADPAHISDVHAVRWAALADLRYALMLGFLEQYLLSAPGDRDFVAAWCFAEMFHLKKLGDFLPVMVRSQTTPGVAAIPFNEPQEFPSDVQDPADATRWPALHGDRLQEARDLVTAILDPANGHPVTPDQRPILENMLEGDRRKLNEARGRETGGTARTRFDQVRETLDWAAGTGSPRHSGQGRFWERPLDKFKATKMFGQLVIEPSQPGAPPLMVEVLKLGDMPQNRPKLDSNDPRVAFIEQWIADGCPDDPL